MSYDAWKLSPPPAARMKECPVCDGQRVTGRPCRTCRGEDSECDDCGGKGVEAAPCPACRGAGEVPASPEDFEPGGVCGPRVDY